MSMLVGRIIAIHAWALMSRLMFVGRILDAGAVMHRLKFVYSPQKLQTNHYSSAQAEYMLVP